MAGNKNLHNAYKAKNDEFYTELSEIEKELSNYKEKFKDKVVFCNCDDPFESNFVKFFLMHFNGYGLKALYATGYKTSPVINTELKVKKEMIPYLLYVTDTSKYLKGDQKDLDMHTAQYFIETEVNNVMSPLAGDENYIAGDFRSKESIEILNNSDIVVTNPPFSLFREYIAQLIDYDKQFIVLGNINAITNKDTFPLLKNNDIWLGCNNGSKEYVVSSKYAEENSDKVYFRNEKFYTKLGNTGWYTNIDHSKRHMMLPLDLGHTYNGHENQYPKYDNFDAINVDKISNIPSDYMGIMGVPISFLEKYCPKQFEIIWQASGNTRASAPKEILEELKYIKHAEDKGGCGVINNKRMFSRIFIKRK